MARHRYLVTYDIADDKRRTKVMKTMRDHGDRLQFSVFRCELDGRELVALRASLSGTIHHADDQVLIVDLGPADSSARDDFEAVGRAYAPEVRARIV
jgi:CRISPR-associated protein Cas2